MRVKMVKKILLLLFCMKGIRLCVKGHLMVYMIVDDFPVKSDQLTYER